MPGLSLEPVDSTANFNNRLNLNCLVDSAHVIYLSGSCLVFVHAHRFSIIYSKTPASLCPESTIMSLWLWPAYKLLKELSQLPVGLATQHATQSNSTMESEKNR